MACNTQCECLASSVYLSTYAHTYIGIHMLLQTHTNRLESLCQHLQCLYIGQPLDTAIPYPNYKIYTYLHCKSHYPDLACSFRGLPTQDTDWVEALVAKGAPPGELWGKEVPQHQDPCLSVLSGRQELLYTTFTVHGRHQRGGESLGRSLLLLPQ